MFIKLKAKTKHGSDRINQHGDTWEFVRNLDNGAKLLKSLKPTFSGGTHDFRRIDMVDKDFEWSFFSPNP